MDHKTIYKNLRWVFWIPLAGAVILAAHLILDLQLLLMRVQRGIMAINSGVTLFLILLAVVFALLTRSRLMKLSESLVRALNAAERNASDVQSQKSRLQTTLNSIGDAVIATDVDGLITLMNPVAEHLTGWAFDDAQGKPLADIFRILNEQTREKVENPVDKVRRLNRIVGLANHTILINKQGQELSIHDSGAPIFGPDRAFQRAASPF